MKLRLLLIASAVALAGCTTSGGSSGMAMSGERPATKAEIETIAVGNTVSGAMTYNTDGSYRYKGGNSGKYRITNGSICVNFDAGGSRCDKIVTDGTKYVLVNREGKRFPFG